MPNRPLARDWERNKQNTRSDALVMLKSGATTLNGSMTINGNFQATGTLADSSGSTGTLGQVLTSTSTGTAWADAAGGAFIADGTKIISAAGTTTHDFIVGSDQIDNHFATTDDDYRMFFDKSSGAFRAGYANAYAWTYLQFGAKQHRRWIQPEAKKTGSFAMGANAKAHGSYSAAIGNNITAKSKNEFVIGYYNTDYTVGPGGDSQNVETDRLFVIGNGTSATPKNALVMLKNGKTTLHGELLVSKRFQNQGSSLLSVQGGIDGGAGRGIHMWNHDDTNWGIYMATKNANSLIGTASATDAPNIEGHAIRLRVANGANTGIIFENSSEKLLASIHGQTGNFVIKGSISNIVSGTHGHPDYVFEQYFEGHSDVNPDYDFPSLESIETFVKKNNHLPGVQSRADIQDAGQWNISENVRTNLEKVEELYLHTIAQEKKINAQEKEIKSLKSALDTLLERMAALENKQP